MNPRVAGIRPFEKRGQHEAIVDERRYVLEAVDRDVDGPVVERLFELLDEEALAADRRKRNILPAIARRPDRHELRVVAGTP